MSQEMDSVCSEHSASGEQFEGRNNRKDWTENQKKDFWKQKRKEKKARRQERNSTKKEVQQEKWQTLSEEEQNALKAQALQVHEKRRAEREATEALCRENLNSKETPIVIYDLSFWDTMSDAGKRSTIAQIKFSFSALKKACFNLRPVITSYNEADVLQKALRDYEGFTNFSPDFHREQFNQVFTEMPCTYLSADSANVLSALESQNCYVIGAFVDHNSQKGATEQFATSLKVTTARLPLSETIKDLGNLCKVLTINHVTDCLSEFKTSGSWEKAFEALPTRRKDVATKE
eukprot:GILI01019235.1.p1 GENE.GILI01019235.1~~GILI01019235.1.p1  ORF type:complete len:303 (+),score=34.46 GILI01019235.1:40-909(+)